MAEASAISAADYVTSLARGLSVMRLFSAATPRLTVSEASRRCGLSRAAVRRLLLTLVAEGYAAHQGDGFTLRPRVMELGYAWLSTLDLPDLAQPPLQEVTAALNENCSLGILDGDDVLYIARSTARRIVQSTQVAIGTRLPASVSSMGRVLLAHLPEAALAEALRRSPPRRLTPATIVEPNALLRLIAQVRKAGYALVEDEFEVGLISVAVPVRNAAGRVVAAINVGAPTARATRAEMTGRYLPAIRAAAAEVERALALRATKE
jgi:IclR family pca regulon transcriptional regulator